MGGMPSIPTQAHVDAFLARFPEFESAAPMVIRNALAYGEGRVSAAVFTDMTRQAVELQAAIFLAGHPFGLDVREGQVEIYRTLWHELMMTRTVGYNLGDVVEGGGLW
jgi:hypothetical protein